MICAERDQLDRITNSPETPSFPAGNDLGEEGLYYFNARWYDPTLGRFITEDPIKDGLNWFAYANNNPLRYTDPTGLKALDEEVNDDGLKYNEQDDKYSFNDGRDVKEETHVEVERSDEEGVFNDEFKVMIGDQVILKEDIHSEKFLESNNPVDYTLPKSDDYYLELLEKSGSFNKPMRITSDTAQGPIPLSPGVKKEDAFLAHPNEITLPSKREERSAQGLPNGPYSENRPQGKGCLIFKNAEDYSKIREGIESLGFTNGEKLPMEIR